MTYQITGVPSSFRAPLTALQLVLGAGASNAPVGRKDACYILPKLSTGTATLGEVYEINSESDASGLGGLGSSAHRIARMHIKKNPLGRIYMIFYAPSSGIGAASAAQTFVITGTATANGSFVVVAFGTEFEVVYRSGQTPTEIGDILEAKINAATFLPGTSANAAGTVTLTARLPGASQNSIHRVRVKKNGDTGSGVSIVATAALLTGGADGAVTEITGFEGALSILEANDSYYLVTPNPVAAFVTAGRIHTVNQNQPIPGKRCRFFYPFTGAMASGASIAITQNTELVECVWQRNADQSPDEIVAWYTASKQLEETTLARFNFDFYPATGFLSPAPAAADWPTLDDVNDGMNDGMAVVVTTSTGVYLSGGVTTRSKDATGALDDFRASESHRIAIMHEMAQIIHTNAQQTYVNFAQEDDPRLPDGSVDEVALQAMIASRTDRFVTPSLYARWLKAQIISAADARLQNVPGWVASVKSRIDPQNNGRMQSVAAGRTVDLHHQSTFRISETTPN